MDQNTLNQTPPPMTPTGPAPIPIPDNFVVETPGSTDFTGAPQKKFPTVLIVVVISVLIILVGGLFLYSQENSPLNNLNNAPILDNQPVVPPSSRSLNSQDDLQTEADSIIVEDVEADFTEVDGEFASW